MWPHQGAIMAPCSRATGGHPGRYSLTYNIQRGGGHSDMPLGYTGFRIGYGTRRVRTGGPMDSGVLLRRRWDPCLAPTVPPTGGAEFLEGDV